jgi:hypothetical protein
MIACAAIDVIGFTVMGIVLGLAVVVMMFILLR